MNQDNIIIRHLELEDIDDVQNFLKKNWRYDHPIANDKNLFLWQYKGYGPAKGYKQYQLAFDKEKLIGIRAVIPELFQIPAKVGLPPVIVTCLASAMWMIDSDYRGLGLGYKLHNITEKLCQASLAMGANTKTSVPIFIKSGYFELRALRRYVVPLEKSGYKQLLITPPTHLKPVIINDFSGHSSLQPITPNPLDLEDVWTKCFSEFFALHRNAEFWKWRYIDSPSFDYFFFGDKKIGFVVARIEDVYMSSTERLGELKVLRIIEILPAESVKENISLSNTTFLDLLRNVLLWGKQNGCCAGDFFSSSSLLENLLIKAGFCLQQPDFSDSKLSLGALFQPFVKKPHVFNLYLRIQDGLIEKDQFDFENSYFVRSDTDQDRPNLLLY